MLWSWYIYLSGWIHLFMIRIGDWALRKPGRPLFVGVVVSVVVALSTVGLLELMEIVSGRQ